MSQPHHTTATCSSSAFTDMS
uniref:Uncharacterized protein n=1 Tax=Anguilla anguilla TaxID=7936 RepID=A0A0E9SR04_ANGAN